MKLKEAIHNQLKAIGERSGLYVSIFIALLVHVSGIIGIVYFQRDFFLGMTPVNLMLMFMLLVWNEKILDRRWFFFFITAFSVGFFTEVVGVNTGWLFGDYAYYNFLGPKIMGVPLLIGINWFCTVYGSMVTVTIFSRGRNIHPVLFASGSAFVATAFDWVMEPIAIKFGYWKWVNDHVPFYNYVCWFIISFLIVLIFRGMQQQDRNRFALPLLLIEFMFFLMLRVLLS
ncbi:MAG: carotenoid biosynthesis protein [Chitinophagia bacterium]|jgi:putative membrane protein